MRRGQARSPSRKGDRLLFREVALLNFRLWHRTLPNSPTDAKLKARHQVVRTAFSLRIKYTKFGDIIK